MDLRSLFVWIGMFAGSAAGSFLSSLLGADIFSFSSIILSAAGGFAGIWIGYKISRTI